MPDDSNKSTRQKPLKSFSVVKIVLLLLLDNRAMEHRFIAGTMVNFLMANPFIKRFIAESPLLFASPMVGIILIVLFVGVWLCLWRMLKSTSAKAPPKSTLLISSIASSVLLFFTALLALHLLLSSYITAAFVAEKQGQAHSAHYRESYAHIKANLPASSSGATITLNKIIKDVENNPALLASLSDDEYRNLTLAVCFLVEEQGEGISKQQHYFRNYFDRAPLTLAEMVDTIRQQPDDIFQWHLLAPEQSFLHMTGPDGEYNLKFISQDGYFEAVYDKNGNLLTSQNAPLNMGTLNYGSPVISVEKHFNYDVTPYYKWGTLPGQAPVEKTKTALIGEQFYSNPDAVAYYEKYKALTKH